MNYQVIARKWRPQTFADVVGQQHVTRTLANAVQSGRVAHAYIFSGARGVGKTTAARILAKALNCAKGPAAEPCNECDSCREIGQGNSLDVIEIDAASNRGIDQIRELREMVRYAPAGGRYKVVILDEAHMLTDEASNALLKTLEEPPDKVIFVMATTEPENLADTIRSRSQHFHFRALSFTEIVDALKQICVKENLTAETGAIAVMARAAEGSLRDALSLLEQARAYCGSNIADSQVRELLGVVPEDILEELTGAIEAKSAERILTLVHRLLAEGQNLQHFCRETIGHFRNLLVARVCGADSELIAAPADQRPRLKQMSESFSEEDLTRFFQILLHTDDDLRRKPDARLHLEMGLLRMVNAARLAPLEELLAELDGGASSSSGGASGPPPGSASNAPLRPAPASSAAPQPQQPVRTPAPAAFAAATSWGAPQAPAAVKMQPAPVRRESPRDAVTAHEHAEDATAPPAQSLERGPERPPERAPEKVNGRESESPVPQSPAGATAPNGAASNGLSQTQVDEIKSAILAQEKFLGELIEHVFRWEMSGGEVRLFFPTESRALAEMLQSRDPMERLRNITSRILGQTVRVCVKLEAVPGVGAATRTSGTRELRAKFEQDPIVREMMERFGGQISDIKRRGEE
ncbi:MAG: DNA polymerase III subunit gamma/tau [Candidatus Acidiferrales bacterium]|jgi:DNA polymerase-3 subunit gamma/tau